MVLGRMGGTLCSSPWGQPVHWPVCPCLAPGPGGAGNEKEVEQVQLKFIQSQYSSPKLKSLLPAATDLIKLNGAFSRAYADGERTTLNLTFHPDDLLSPYSQDLAFFCQHAQKTKLHIVVQPEKKGVEWRQVKKG